MSVAPIISLFPEWIPYLKISFNQIPRITLKRNLGEYSREVVSLSES